mmetsp:Transcript_29999/g.72038  ORF Transcript_29999/g.72038 Transcript_29999/m.72038 type:complete len:85 (-) Transcript_29999:10-264(-)
MTSLDPRETSAKEFLDDEPVDSEFQIIVNRRIGGGIFFLTALQIFQLFGYKHSLSHIEYCISIVLRNRVVDLLQVYTTHFPTVQ